MNADRHNNDPQSWRELFHGMTPVMISIMPPIRRGTASGLCLRTPYQRPRGIIRFPRELTPEDVDHLIARFREAEKLGAYRSLVLGDWGFIPAPKGGFPTRLPGPA